MFLAGFEEYEDTSIWFALSKIKTKFSRLGWDRVSEQKLLFNLLYNQPDPDSYQHGFRKVRISHHPD